MQKWDIQIAYKTYVFVLDDSTTSAHQLQNSFGFPFLALLDVIPALVGVYQRVSPSPQIR